MADQKKNFSNVVTNRTTEFSASAPAVFTAGRVATIEVDTGVEWIDMDTAVLLCDMTLNQNGEASAIGAVRYTSSAYMGTMAIKTASNQPLGDPLTGYNFIARQEQEFTENTAYAASYGDATERTAGKAAVNADGAVMKLCHKPRTHLFNKGYYPAHYHGGFKIIITMAPNNEVVLAGHASHTYTISNLRLSANLVTFTGETETAQRAQVATGYHINYKTKHLVQTSLDVAVTTSRSEVHLGSVPSPLDTIQTYQILDTPAIAVDKFAAVVPYALTSYQYTLAGKPLTDHVIDTTVGAAGLGAGSAQRVHELLKSRGMLDGHFKNLFGSTTLTTTLQETTKFAIGQKVSKGDDESEISSRRTNSTNALKVFYTRSAAAGAGAKSWMSVLTLDKNLVILPGSQVRNQDFLDYINP